mmetsp:Transcript_13608/g.22181  ORF Transcript_13608/g.22181 Transcript_13608/m.22181 type:complete len:303 (-) Transcript_13608:1305-2213(-)
MAMSRRNKQSRNQVHSQSSSNFGIEEEKHVTFVKCISDRLETLNLCSSYDEYSSISEAIGSSAPIDTPPSEDDLENVASALLEYFSEEVTKDDAKALVYAAAFDAWGADLAHITDMLNNADDGSDCSKSQIGDDEDSNSDEYENNDEDGDFIGEGECELCERSIKLTRHHLIPKATWPRMKKRLWNAAPLIESLHSLSSRENETNGQQHRQLQIQEKKKVLQCKLGTTNLSNLPATITRGTIRAHLSQVCSLCRICHSAIHRLHTEWELAVEYNTMERLLNCEEVMKFGRWANKQRPGKYAT